MTQVVKSHGPSGQEIRTEYSGDTVRVVRGPRCPVSIKTKAPNTTTKAHHMKTKAHHIMTKAHHITTKAHHMKTKAPNMKTKAYHIMAKAPLITTKAHHIMIKAHRNIIDRPGVPCIVTCSLCNIILATCMPRFSCDA